MSSQFTHSRSLETRKSAIVHEIACEIFRRRLNDRDLVLILPTCSRKELSYLRNRHHTYFSESRLLAIAEALGLRVTVKIERVAA
jgi:hypothetical protein